MLGVKFKRPHCRRPALPRRSPEECADCIADLPGEAPAPGRDAMEWKFLLVDRQPLETVDQFTDRTRPGCSGDSRREAVFAPDHGVLAAGIVLSLEAFQRDLEIGDRIDAGLRPLPALDEALNALDQVAPRGADGGGTHRHGSSHST